MWAIYTNAHEAVVPQELFDLVQSRHERIAALNRRTREQDVLSPLPQGMLRCAKCGSVTEFHKSAKAGFETTQTYMCRRRRDRGARYDVIDCFGSVTLEYMRKRVLAHVAKLLEQDGEELRAAMLAYEAKANAEIARLEAVLKAETRKRERFLDAFRSTEDPAEASLYFGRVKAAKFEIESAEQSLRALRAMQPRPVDPDSITTDALTIRHALENVDIPVLRDRLGEVFSEIRIDLAAASALRSAYKTLEGKFLGKPVEKVKAAKRKAAEIADEIQWAQGGPITFVYRWQGQGPVTEDNTAEIAASVAGRANVPRVTPPLRQPNMLYPAVPGCTVGRAPSPEVATARKGGTQRAEW